MTGVPFEVEFRIPGTAPDEPWGMGILHGFTNGCGVIEAEGSFRLVAPGNFRRPPRRAASMPEASQASGEALGRIPRTPGAPDA